VPIKKAKAAVEHALRKLEPGDSFQIIRFSNNASQLGAAPVPATAANVRKGLSYLKSLEGEGGTMMIKGIKAALDFPHDPQRLRVVSFMTDGFIGNEDEIFAAVQQRIGESRIFSFGVGSSVNRYLIEGLARMGKGAVAYVGLDESGGKQVDLFYDRVSHPAMTDISIDWGTMNVADAYPRRIPDLFVGRPVIVSGRFNGSGTVMVKVHGKVAGRDEVLAIPVTLDDASAEHTGIAAVWARTKMADLAYQATHDDNPELPLQIQQVALDYGLMSDYTAFVAVDSLTRTAGGSGTTVHVPVPVPEGVKYETTVAE